MENDLKIPLLYAMSAHRGTARSAGSARDLLVAWHRLKEFWRRGPVALGIAKGLAAHAPEVQALLKKGSYQIICLIYS